ncbi:MAG: penicillin-binding protein 1C, partial [Candidatus Sumerlaeaceae bacterium]|nr:penicillin-binding protein 1C [Candidatus Sumerlaeaceae bacterium]
MIKAVGGSLVALTVVWLACPLFLRWVPFDPDKVFTGDVSTTIYDRKARLLRAYLARDDQWRIAVPLKEISPWVIRATLAAEDRRFFQHGGIDWRALVRAAWQNMRSGRVISGASTITMQVVGLADSRERTLWRKLRQMLRALQLERWRTKEEILELYLTNAPYGGNVRGIEAAAWRYFGKSSRDLTAAEAALLAGIPQAPSRLRPDRFPHAARRRALLVLERMHEFGYLTADDFQRATRQLPEIKTAAPPVLAPHFCDLLRERFPREPRIHTTLDLDLQRTLEQMVDEQLRRFSSQGITNAAAVVLDNFTGDVLALVGSADYWNPAIAGQVNGAMAPRSPGSTLKPFIYALALQRGAVCPTTVLADVPGLFSNYDPKNFDRQWRGLVPLDRALAWSLNVPAMQVLERVGTSGLLELLDAAGVRRTMPRQGEVGLTLAVGTCSVRLLELANAYAMLARGGLWQPYRLAYPPSADESRLIESARRWNLRMARERQVNATEWKTSASVRLLNEDACYYVNLILSDDRLRDPSECSPELRGFRGVAWKTGTSNGYRDAWTIAYDPNWTVGVWFGNFDGKPSSALVGGAVAAPVALRVINTLRQNQPAHTRVSEWPYPPGRPEPVSYTHLTLPT